ncbi:hypothetical protein [Burkholderia ubonensis]|uniref:hypothetical protein n=1 Tax=Burkholderia ubonensis TaxID=101571 RepID=UPI000AE31A41|nr:hypothetical protein [Burkholderia ubonensis]
MRERPIHDAVRDQANGAPRSPSSGGHRRFLSHSEKTVNHCTVSDAVPHSDVQLALALLVRRVDRVTSALASRVASGDETPQRAAALIARHGASLAETAHYFGAPDIAHAIAAAVDQGAVRLNPPARNRSPSLRAAGAAA